MFVAEENKGSNEVNAGLSDANWGHKYRDVRSEKIGPLEHTFLKLFWMERLLVVSFVCIEGIYNFSIRENSALFVLIAPICDLGV